MFRFRSTSRLLTAATAAAVLALSSACVSEEPAPVVDEQGRQLRSVVFATGSTTGGPHFAIQEIGTILGFYAEEGLFVTFKHAGGNAQATAEMESGRAMFATGTPAFQVTNLAENGAQPGVNFFEYAYPMKWDIAVTPDSPIRTLSQLSGKTLGISALGTADEQVAREWLRLAGVDPDTVTLTVTGGGLPAGTALQDGKLDAILLWDTHRGQYDVANIAYRLLPRPEGLSMLGGFYLQTKPETIKNDRQVVVGLGRATLKGSIFALANPEAAAAIYLDLHPEAGEGKSREEAVAELVKIMKYRMANLMPYDPEALPGSIKLEEWINEVKFAGLEDKISDPSVFFTNELIEEINDFDKAAIEELARNYDWRKS